MQTIYYTVFTSSGERPVWSNGTLSFVCIRFSIVNEHCFMDKIQHIVDIAHISHLQNCRLKALSAHSTHLFHVFVRKCYHSLNVSYIVNIKVIYCKISHFIFADLYNTTGILYKIHVSIFKPYTGLSVVQLKPGGLQFLTQFNYLSEKGPSRAVDALRLCWTQQTRINSSNMSGIHSLLTEWPLKTQQSRHTVNLLDNWKCFNNFFAFFRSWDDWILWQGVLQHSDFPQRCDCLIFNTCIYGLMHNLW